MPGLSVRWCRWLFNWAPVIVLPVAVFVFVPPAWPRWALMWAVAIAIFGSLKWLTWRQAPIGGAPPWKQAGYLLAWPGFDAAAFLKPTATARPARPTVGEWLFAACKLATGIGLLWLAARRISPELPYLVGWVGMIGIIMVLHFGSFHLLSCAWRCVGVEARPLMNWPLASDSVGEFWGQRWNTAFRDLTHRFLFRPLAARLGARWALSTGFVFSGLLHDLVVSVPARGGYGGPTLFFAVQAAAIFAERSAPGRRIRSGRAWRGRLFTMLVLVAPVYFLFHPPFVVGVVVPFMRAIGAIELSYKLEI